ncbi:tetratricopeptide repeat protein [Simplicispira suum]|uniref:Sel1 repeat family protein n=1 Tax=Simplicispira suum TaxID=2109915 RepID=A0A2S0N5R2_9BURK|nr:tetratricopeptide repeat protein [Simplicispira suum]AVO43446.1 sel1 repeat family protein [Simplicispira suum]
MKPFRKKGATAISTKLLAFVLLTVGALQASAASSCSYPQDEISSLRIDYAKAPYPSGYGKFDGPIRSWDMLDIPRDGQAEASRLFVQAKTLMSQGDEDRGIRLANRSAECGDDDAIMFLAELSIARNNNNGAAKYLELGSKKNLPKAKYLLAEQYDQGALGFPKDLKRAFILYYAAAQSGIPQAMSAVAYYFVRGQHGVKDELAALHWYHKAALAGHVESMTAYGWMLMVGKGGPVDREEAAHYLHKAKALGDRQARVFLSDLAITTKNVR